MNALILALLMQSLLALPPRTAMENPAAASDIPQKLKKDYDQAWARFVTAKDDGRLVKDLDKILQKQKTFDAAWTLEGYIALYKGEDATAREKFTQAVTGNPKNRIATYYLAEIAYAHNEYANAATLYAQLLSIGTNRSEIETKRQKAFLLATDSLLRGAARAEGENRLSEAEGYYRDALKLAPNEPTLHARLANLLIKENKKDEAEAERKAADDLSPRRAIVRPTTETAVNIVRADDLEDLGRWGGDINIFHEIRDAEVVTREQFAILISRYFPQLTEFRQSPQIITDIQNSRARFEIQTTVGVGLMEVLPNHYFEPLTPMKRGDLAKALARLSRLLGVSGAAATPIAAPDLAPANALYSDVQLVLGSGIMTLQDSGSFDVSGDVSGQQAVRSADRLVRTFQQLTR
jgi:tetratricopeptide (TPR) repeat protein